MTETAERLANEAMSEGENIHEVFIDPATIIVCVKVIITLIGLYKNCKKSHTEATVSCKEMGVIEQRVVKREVRKHLGAFKYLSQGGVKLAEKIINRAKRLNEDEMERLYQEVE